MKCTQEANCGLIKYFRDTYGTLPENTGGPSCGRGDEFECGRPDRKEDPRFGVGVYGPAYRVEFEFDKRLRK